MQSVAPLVYTNLDGRFYLYSQTTALREPPLSVKVYLVGDPCERIYRSPDDNEFVLIIGLPYLPLLFGFGHPSREMPTPHTCSMERSPLEFVYKNESAIEPQLSITHDDSCSIREIEPSIES